jgi:hypothetical protein
MAPLHNNRSKELLFHGWKHPPDGRGTMNILNSCACTIFLCSWSSVTLNVPEPDQGNLGFLLYKIRWQLFTIFFPEVIVAIAAEQWESANQSVEKFKILGHPHWTLRHAFYTDMGGVLLQTPDFPPFPIDCQQLAYLVEHQYLPMPLISQNDIWDRNKSDGFARGITLAQVLWFCTQCIFRGAQHIGLSTIELSTLGFIVCTLNTFFFWLHKPYDVRTQIILTTEHRMADLLIAAGESARLPYKRTPLDFMKPPPDPKSLIAPFWFGIAVVLDVGKEPRDRPIRTFGNNKTMPPAGITTRETIYGIMFELVYFGMHLIGWNFTFPSYVEKWLWRASSLTGVGLVVFYLVLIPTGLKLARPVGLRLFKKEVNTPLELAALLPRWAAVLIHGPVLILYCTARAYILLEGFISLRVLPARLYETVDWLGLIPHI